MFPHTHAPLTFKRVVLESRQMVASVRDIQSAFVRHAFVKRPGLKCALHVHNDFSNISLFAGRRRVHKTQDIGLFRAAQVGLMQAAHGPVIGKHKRNTFPWAGPVELLHASHDPIKKGPVRWRVQAKFCLLIA
jgi:hypothetical protein